MTVVNAGKHNFLPSGNAGETTTISLLQENARKRKRFATITAYDYSFASLSPTKLHNVMLAGWA